MTAMGKKRRNWQLRSQSRKVDQCDCFAHRESGSYERLKLENTTSPTPLEEVSADSVPTEFALQIYLDFTNEARHAEEQIPSLANVLILVVAGLLGIDSIIGAETSVLSYGFMILIGSLGLVSSNKFRQRKYHAIHRALEFRELLNRAEPSLEIDGRVARARKKDLRKFPLSTKFSSAIVWGVFYVFIIVIGGWGVWQHFS
jgi:hypothetical protein